MSFIVWTVIFCSGWTALGVAVPSEGLVEAGREAFDEQGTLPWYDADADSLQRVEIEPWQDDDKRLSDWASADRPKTSRDWGWLMEIVLTILKILAWASLGVIVALIIWALVWALRRRETRAASGVADQRKSKASEYRVEDLPMPVQPEYTDLLAAAKAFLETGDLGKAIIYAFAHQLVELDKHHLIQLAKGKTNRQYLRELKPHPEFIDQVTPIMLAFEDVFFGHHELTRKRFDNCWQRLDRFHHQLEQVAS